MSVIFFCKQNTAYEMRISDWSSDVCSSDLARLDAGHVFRIGRVAAHLNRVAAGRQREGGAGQQQADAKSTHPAARAARSRRVHALKIGRASCRERVCQYV